MIAFIKYIFSRPATGTRLYEAIWCRLRNHPAGLVWYNPNGFEPDMHCKFCGDNLG